MKEVIAEELVIFESRDGTRREGVILIEKPEVDDEGEASCTVIIDGLHERMPAVTGPTTLRALLLGVCFCASLLRDFVAQGGRIFRATEDEGTSSDEEFDIDECFGPLASLRVPPSQRRQANSTRRSS